MKPQYMSAALANNMARGWEAKPHLRDPNNWPTDMLEQWGKDQGLATAEATQSRIIGQLQKAGQALDDFAPELIVVLFRDTGGSFGNTNLPLFHVHGHEQLEAMLYQLAYGPVVNRENYFDEDPGKVDVIEGHPEAAEYLTDALRTAGFDPAFSTAPDDPRALVHLFATAVHLDWDKRTFETPVLPISFDPFGFGRTRGPEGLSTWERSATPPLDPAKSFKLGAAIAKTLHDSPWRTAVVAGTDWSHANDTDAAMGRLHPDVEADERRYQEWSSGNFQTWGRGWDFEEMEEHGQWQMQMTIVLAGAMTTLGAQIVYSDFQPNLLFNSDTVTTIFEAK